MEDTKVIFLDRDGVINAITNGTYITDPRNLYLISGSGEAIKIINDLGYKIIVVTNQSIIGRKMGDHRTVRKLHEKLDTLLEQHNAIIDHYLYCFHHPDENCSCRKPKINMFKQAQAIYNIDIKNSWLIGDHRTDIEFGTTAGLNTALLKTGFGMLHINDAKPDFIFDDLKKAITYIKDNYNG